MNVTKVELKVNQALFGKCYFAGTVFYVTAPYRRGNSFEDRSDVFSDRGELLGAIEGYYFDFGNKEVFKESNP